MNVSGAPAPATESSACGPGAVWQLDLLGRVQAHSAKASITRWPTRAVASLLARLAMAPQRAHPREELIALLWPEAPADKGRARLRQALSNLRSLLQPGADSAHEPLLADRQTVRLNPVAVACDVLQFKRLAQAGQHEQARALYVGELMPGYYDEWVLEARQQLQALLERLPAMALPGTQPALPKAWQAEAPIDDAATISAFQVRLPAYWTRAFGQRDAMQQLTQRIASQRLVTVIGPGGHGKTRLAVATAAEFDVTQAPGFQRRIFVPLADATDAGDVWSALAGALCIEGSGDPTRRVPATLGQTASLLILDNAEQLEGPAVMVMAQLLKDCPSLHLLVTSRRRLGLDGECLFEIQGLELPARDELAAGDSGAAAADSPAVALFVDRARQSRADFHLTAQNAAPVVDLVRLLGGMPLAIELAASRLRALQPRELLQRLRQDAGSPTLDLLARPAGNATGGTRHASMRQVVAWSWRQLPEPVAALLRALSVFTAPVTAAAAAQALVGLTAPVDLQDHADPVGSDTAGQRDAPAVDGTTLLTWMAEAADASLVQLVHQRQSPFSPDGDTTYALAPPVREFAAELCTPAERLHMRSRLRRWMADLANRNLPQQRSAVQPDLVHAWPLLLRANDDEAPREALALALALQSEWSWRPAMPRVIAVLDWALSRLPQEPPDAMVSRGHYLLAAMHQMRADGSRAALHAQLALRSAPDAPRRAMAVSIGTWIRLESGEQISADDAELGQALQWIRAASDSRATALVLSVQAQAAQDCDEDFARAISLLLESVQLFEQVGDKAQAGVRQVQLATCWASDGEHERARSCLQDIVSQADATTESMLRIYALSALGRVNVLLGHNLQAHDSLQQAAALAQAHDWRALVLPALLPMPLAWAQTGAARDAARLQAYVLHRWPKDLGQFKPSDARSNQALSARLKRDLGAIDIRTLQQEGQAMTEDQVLAWVAQNRPLATPN